MVFSEVDDVNIIDTFGHLECAPITTKNILPKNVPA